MNCQQLDDLLPLYAGRDLDEKRARLVSEHIQICSACARVAGEYRDAVELTQHFAPPVFSDNVYASVRRQVMQQIEAEPTTSLLPQLFAGWFRPRMAWAGASVLIIAFGLFALYLVVNRTADVPPVAETHPPIIEYPGSTPTPQTTNPANAGTPLKPTKDKGKGIRRFVNRSPKAMDSSSRTASVSPRLRNPEANSLPARDAAPAESPLRVEIQTQNPNIRIIWFSQQSTKPASPNSKGI